MKINKCVRGSDAPNLSKCVSQVRHCVSAVLHPPYLLASSASVQNRGASDVHKRGASTLPVSKRRGVTHLSTSALGDAA